MSNRLYRVLAPAALVAAIAIPAFAQSALILPPYDGSGPMPKIATEDQALATLRARGLTHIAGLGLVGDYWEGEGVLRGRPVVAYLFGNGALEVKPAQPGEHVPVPVQSAEAP
jgi:hypothetical protein